MRDYILYTISRICTMFNKPNASNWIILKIFETSPFILSNIHYNSAVSLLTYLEKNKLKMPKYDKSEKIDIKKLKEDIIKQVEKTKKYFSKLIPRINAKNMNLNKKNLLQEKMQLDISNNASFITKSDENTSRGNFSLNFRKDYQTGKSSYNMNLKKI